MNSSNSNLLTSSSYQNIIAKRSVFEVTEESVGNCKKIKPNFQEDINNVVPASHGYMTRHKLKQKQLASDNHFKTNVSLGTSFDKDKSIIQPIKTTKKKKKKPTITYKKKVELSYDNNIFGTNISLIKTSFKKEKSIIQPRKTIQIKKPSKTYKSKSKYDVTFNNCLLADKQTHAQRQKLPSLFESDSDLEIDYFQINHSKKSKVNEKFASSPEIEDIRPVFNKNAEIKTYYNKKSNIVKSQLKATYNAIGNQLISEENNFLEKMSDCSVFQNNINSNINTTDVMTYQNTCDTIKHEENKKLEMFTNSIKNHDSFLNGNLNFKLVKSNKSANLQLDSKCCCRSLFNFNKDANKISTSKTKHFAFDDDKKKFQTFLQQKQLEANMLKQLIESNESIIQSEGHVRNLNFPLFNQSRTKLISVDKNNHIEPYISQILKDFYVDFDYLSECFDSDSSDDELKGSINLNIKIYNEAPIPNDNLTFMKDDNFFTSNIKSLNKPSDTVKLSKDTFKKLDFNKSELNVTISKEEAIDNLKSHMEEKANFSLIKKNYINIKTTTTDIKQNDNHNVVFDKTKMYEHLNTKTNKTTVITPNDDHNVSSNKNKNDVIPKRQNSIVFDLSDHNNIERDRSSNLIKDTIDDNVLTSDVKTIKQTNNFHLFKEENDNSDDRSISNMKVSKEFVINPKTCEKNLDSLDKNINTVTKITNIKNSEDHIVKFNKTKNNVIPKRQNSIVFDLSDHNNIERDKSSNLIKDTIDDNVLTSDVKTIKQTNNFHLFKEENDNSDDRSISNMKVSKEFVINPKTCEKNLDSLDKNINTVTKITNIKNSEDHIVKFNKTKNNFIPKRQKSSLFDLSDHNNIERDRSSNLIKDTIDDNVLTSDVKTIKQTNNFHLFKEENDNSDGRSISNMKVSKEFIINPKTCEKNLDSLDKNINTVTKITNIKNSDDHIVKFDKTKNNFIPKRQKSSLFDLSDHNNIERDKSSNLIKDTIDDNVLTSDVKTIKQTNNFHLFKEENDNSDGRSISNMKVSKEFIINPKTCEKNLDSLDKNINTVTKITNIKNSDDHIVKFDKTKNNFIPKRQKSSLFDLSDHNNIERDKSSNLIKDTIDDNVLTSDVKTIKQTNNFHLFKEENDNSDGRSISNMKVSKEFIINPKTCEKNLDSLDKNINTVTKITNIKNSDDHIVKFNKTKNNFIPKRQKSSLFDLSDHNNIERDKSSNLIKDTIDDNVLTSNVKTFKLIKNVNLLKEKNDNLDGNGISNVKLSKKSCEKNFVCSNENINTETKMSNIKNSVDHIVEFNETKNCTIPKQHNSSLFNLFDYNDIESDSSSDDDCYKLLIDEKLINSKISDIQIKNEGGVQLMNVNAKKTNIQIKNDHKLEKVDAIQTNKIKILNEESVQLRNVNNRNMNTQIKNDQDNKLINLNTDTKIQNKNAIKSVLPKKESILCNKPDNSCVLNEAETTLQDYNLFMSIEKCNEFYKKQPLNKGISFNENKHFSKSVQDIFSEMYVDTVFVSNCQHMVELCDGQLRNVELMNIKNQNYKNKMFKEKCNQPIPNNIQPITEKEMNTNCKQSNKPLLNPISTLQKLNSSQKQKNISNIQIRMKLREMLKSNQPMNVILKSTEFKNLSNFCEEEISSTICVLLFENIFNPLKITGLTTFGVNCENMNNEEKNELFGSTNLSITCPKIMKLTSITLELVKLLQSDRLISMILNSIRNNILNKKINLNNKTDHQLIMQTLYLVDICNRLGMLKYIQTFIWDSIVLLPNKYCCVLFMSLMLWNNCLPVKLNNEQDPVIIMAISYLIAKRKSYSKINIDATVDHNIYQQELINLLSFYYNYSFTVDLPTNLIKHKHKPDFFPSVMMVLKCSYAKDMVEFTIHCLFPIIEEYLNTQQDEAYAIQTMESIFHSFKLFRFSFRPTVTGYLNSRKSTENNFEEDKTSTYTTLYQSYKTLLNKMIEYINDSRPRSQYFEELLVSIIMLLGCVDYCTCCAILMKWEPKFEPSPILTRKYDIFKSILGHTLWNRLCVIDDINTIMCLINVCTLGDEFYHTLEKLQ